VNKYLYLSLKKPKPIKPTSVKNLAVDDLLKILRQVGRWPDSSLKQDADLLVRSELERARIFEAKAHIH
jgi:hypothetical protein